MLKIKLEWNEYINYIEEFLLLSKYLKFEFMKKY